jgi:ubiquinone/menaquinone biosynthesis C-methylase UbiE
MEIATWLDNEPAYLGETWTQALEPRKQEEASFHDSYREGHQDETDRESHNKRWYEAVLPIHRYLEERIAANAPGKVVLDYACGSGGMTLLFAKHGATLSVGIDISETSVRSATENARRQSSHNVRFLQRDCESTGLPSNTFDTVLCSGMLHHLDLSRAFPELHRILKPNGRVLCFEALDHNPFIKLYRKRTPQLRTAWEAEHILSMNDVKYARKWFRVENVRYFFVTAPLATLLPRGKPRAIGLKACHAIDLVLTKIPFLRLWSWQFAFELVKTQ